MSNMKLNLICGAGLVLGCLTAPLPAQAFVYEYLKPIPATPMPLKPESEKANVPTQVQNCWDGGKLIGLIGGSSTQLMCWDPTTPGEGEVNPFRSRGVSGLPGKSAPNFYSAVNSCLAAYGSVGPNSSAFVCVKTPQSLLDASARGPSSSTPRRRN